MNDEGGNTLRATLEPSEAEVERVVAAALAAGRDDGRRRASGLAVVVALFLIAMIFTVARRERTFTELLLVAPEPKAMGRVSNVGTVMLVEGGSHRTLIANTRRTKELSEEQHSYRIMISKGTIP